VYQCAIQYTGNNEPLDIAVATAMTINGVTYDSNPKLLNDLDAISNNLATVVSNAGATYAEIMVSTNNVGAAQADITANSGEIRVYVYIFYPNQELTGNIEVTINGTPQTFNFEKKATA